MLEVSEVKVTFNAGLPTETHALRGLNLKVASRQFITVIGSNGAGKSTLLNAISGDVRVSSGKIKVDDTDITAQNSWHRARAIARVFQDPMAGTCEALSIEENMALAYSRGKKRLLRRAVTAACRELFRYRLHLLNLGLESRLSDRVGLLSGGQRQALSLLMAALQPSKILLLDEHTAALDPKTSAFVLELTKKIVEENHLTTMMVTHSMRQALDYGERTVMLHQGKIVLDVSGAQHKQLDVPALLAMFEHTRHEELSDDTLLLG